MTPASSHILYSTIVQILGASGEYWEKNAIAKKIREIYAESKSEDERALAYITTIDMVAAVRKLNEAHKKFGLYVEIGDEEMSMAFTPSTNHKLKDFIDDCREKRKKGRREDEEAISLSLAAKEVYIMIAFKGPISILELEREWGGEDKTYFVKRLEARGWIDSFKGAGGVNFYQITDKSLRDNGLSSKEQLFNLKDEIKRMMHSGATQDHFRDFAQKIEKDPSILSNPL